MSEKGQPREMCWTVEEDNFIREHSDWTVKELAAELGRTVGGVRSRKYHLGVKRGNCPLFTEEELNMICDYYTSHDGVDLIELSKIMHRPKTSISEKAHEMGLTKYGNFTQEWREELSKTFYERVKDSNPKRFLGGHHTEETKHRLGEISKERASKMTREDWDKRTQKAKETIKKNGTHHNTGINAYSRCRQGVRPDLNQYFRSAWEANVARIYNHNNIKWEYESKRFMFENPVYGVESYQPDFYLPELDKWVEVKGWMDDKSVIRLVLFKQEYPEEYDKLEIIGKNEYYALYKQYKSLDNFELEYADRKRLENIQPVCEKENRIDG